MRAGSVGIVSTRREGSAVQGSVPVAERVDSAASDGSTEHHYWNRLASGSRFNGASASAAKSVLACRQNVHECDDGPADDESDDRGAGREREPRDDRTHARHPVSQLREALDEMGHAV